MTEKQLLKKVKELGEEPAFPNHYSSGGGSLEVIESDGGLTKREYFAGLAMQALANAITNEEECGIIHNCPKDIAEISLTYADCLLLELVKEEE